MNSQANTGGLDRFRLAGALLVAAIHTSPLTCISPEADFFLTRVLARVAVPFFLMVTGYFVLPRVLRSGVRSGRRLLRYLVRMGLLYLACVLLYLPLGIYAGHYRDLTVAKVLRLLVWDGTFYHLWYFPACMLGMFLLYLLSRRLGCRSLACVCALLYLLGLSGDSYYGLTQYLPPLRGLWDLSFTYIWSYTRNGLFLAPLFLLMGAYMADGLPEKGKSELPPEQASALPWEKASLPALAVGLVLSLSGMTGEAFLLRHLDWLRHDSMYLLLVPVMYFLYSLLLRSGCPPAPELRRISTFVYILHPAVIVAVRICARLPHMLPLMEQSLLHYLAVCLLSLAAAWLLTLLSIRRPGQVRPHISDSASHRRQ